MKVGICEISKSSVGVDTSSIADAGFYTASTVSDWSTKNCNVSTYTGTDLYNDSISITGNRYVWSKQTIDAGDISSAVLTINTGVDISEKKNKRIIGDGIDDVQVYNNRVVLVRFKDGSFTKAVCGENDEFNLEVGITVCLMKKLLGGQEKGTRVYNDILRDALKRMSQKEKERKDEKAEAERIKKKRRNAELKRAAKALRRKEEAIEIQKQGFLRALQEQNRMNEDDLK